MPCQIIDLWDKDYYNRESPLTNCSLELIKSRNSEGREKGVMLMKLVFHCRHGDATEEEVEKYFN